MSSKIITTVITTMIIAPFAYIVANDAVSIKQNLREQSIHIEKLNTEYVKLDTQLDETQEVKEQAVEEVQKLEEETQNAIAERQRLEAEIGAN